MNCPYCKQEIPPGAKKCHICGEYLGLRRGMSGFYRFFNFLIPVLSLLFAYYQAKLKEVEETKREANEEILENFTREQSVEEIREIAVREPAAQINRSTSPEQLERNITELKREIRKKPNNLDAQKALIYNKMLLEKSR
jgi:hypothetical protein